MRGQGGQSSGHVGAHRTRALHHGRQVHHVRRESRRRIFARWCRCCGRVSISGRCGHRRGRRLVRAHPQDAVPQEPGRRRLREPQLPAGGQHGPHTGKCKDEVLSFCIVSVPNNFSSGFKSSRLDNLKAIF